MRLTIAEYAKKVKTSENTIRKRIEQKLIISFPLKRGGRYVSMIDTVKFPPEKQPKRSAGRPFKK